MVSTFLLLTDPFNLVAQPDQWGYRVLMWLLSNGLIHPVPSDIVETTWFNLSATIALPILVTGIALSCALSLWSGLVWALRWSSDR